MTKQYRCVCNLFSNFPEGIAWIRPNFPHPVYPDKILAAGAWNSDPTTVWIHISDVYLTRQELDLSWALKLASREDF